MYGSAVNVSLSFKIGSQIMGINVGLDVANELVLNVFTPQWTSTSWINVPDNITQRLVCWAPAPVQEDCGDLVKEVIGHNNNWKIDHSCCN